MAIFKKPMPTPVQSIEKLISEGRFLEARRMAEQQPGSADDKRLKQLLALSMSKSGALKAAIQLLEPVYKNDPTDPETSGILGSIYKEAFKLTRSNKYAVLSRDTYLANFNSTGNYYTGINAATMYAISGSGSKAREIAKILADKLSEETTDIWELATLAEAYLLLKERDKSATLYLKTRNLLDSDWGKVGSIYNQLWLLNHYVPVSKQVMSIFNPPVVAAFVGHMTDHPNRAIPRFPESISNDIKKALSGAINTINAKIGFCSVASGGDILFAEAMIETGGEVNIYLPFDQADFIETSISFAAPEWRERYNKLISSHQVTYVTTERYASTDELFTFQTQVMFGAAMRRAAMLHGTPHLISVFADSDMKIKEGGTRDTLKMWPVNEKRVNINPQNFFAAPPPKTEVVPTPARSFEPRDERRHIRYLLSVDLSASNDATRLHDFMKGKTESYAEQMNTSEDGYLLALVTPEETIALALELQKAAGSSPVKISLHAGPVFINKQAPFVEGPSVSILKDVETFSVPGKIFVTMPVAAVLSIDPTSYAVEFSGTVSLSNGEKEEVFQINREIDVFDL